MADIQPGRYHHFKGNEYQVLGIARHSETLEELVVYRALYGDGGLWVRPASMWTETVDRDGYHAPRFIGGAERGRTIGWCGAAAAPWPYRWTSPAA